MSVCNKYAEDVEEDDDEEEDDDADEEDDDEATDVEVGVFKFNIFSFLY